MKPDKEGTEHECCCHGMHHHHAGKAIMFAGLLAFLYGFIHYVRIMYLASWPPYSTWMIGGGVLILIGWMKKKM